MTSHGHGHGRGLLLRARTRRALVAALAVVALGSVSIATRAAVPAPARADRVMSPGRLVASDDSSDAVALNPANVAWMPGAELRWTGVRCPDTQKIGCGHAFGFATPLFAGLATGLRVDWVMPPDTASFPFAGYDYAWVTWALGMRLSDTFSLGFSLQRAYSESSYVDGLFGVTASASLRPNTHFGFSVVAHDFNNPSPQMLPLLGGPVLDRSWDFAMAFRPTGTRDVEIGVEAKYLEGAEQVLPKLLVGIDVPHLGRARGDLQLAHVPNDANRSIVGTAGLEIAIDRVTAGGGVIAGNGLGSNAAIGEFATASVAGFRSPGFPSAQRAVWIRFEATPGTRTHVSLLRRLWKISEDPDIKAVTFVLKAEPAATFAHAEELADALRVLRARGKKVLCAWEDAGARSLYVCANANRIVVNPAGGLRYAGLQSQYVYLAGLLSKIGVKAEFVRIGAHKSAPEQFTNDKASDVARDDHLDMLRETEAVFVKNLAQGRHLSPEQVRAATLRGPFVAAEARDARFVDAYAFDDEVEKATQEMVGWPIRYEKYEDVPQAPRTFGPRDRVAILYVDGDIVDGRSSTIPLLDMKLVGGYTIADTAKAIREDASIKAVVLRIESPGGSSMASDVMWRELSLLAQKKPLIVSMGSIAASGGYYVASPARKIFALPLTVTGSIGIFYGKADVSGLLQKLGISVETYKTTPRADQLSMFRGFTDDERHELERKVHQFYDVFLDRVSQGRHMTKEQVDAVGQGRVWSGQEALDRHLVDAMGGIREALDEARAAGGLPHDAPIVELPIVPKTLIERALELAGFDRATPLVSIEQLPEQVRDVARAVAPMAVYSGDTPLARMEWVPTDAWEGADRDDDGDRP